MEIGATDAKDGKPGFVISEFTNLPGFYLGSDPHPSPPIPPYPMTREEDKLTGN
jgi:hypothetical protein